jgi:abhydrolase domain-containing protein 14
MSEQVAKVENIRIRYWTNISSIPMAEKPTVVLFHGNAFSLDNWKEIGTLDALTREKYPTFAIDLPAGKGSKSDKVDETKHTLYRDLVPLIEKIFQEIGISSSSSSRLVIIGPSMGGGFAIAYALEHKERVEGLVLVAPSVGELGEEDSERISELEMPVLLIWGDKDNVISLQQDARSLKDQLIHSKLIILKDAGHAAYLSKPEEFNDLLFDFLSEIT